MNGKYIDICGNKNYVLYNNYFLTFKNTQYYSIYELPIKKYDFNLNKDKLLVMPDYTMKQFLLIYNMTF